jgi:hypothetical protein
MAVTNLVRDSGRNYGHRYLQQLPDSKDIEPVITVSPLSSDSKILKALPIET